jgi:hypothetical protein
MALPTSPKSPKNATRLNASLAETTNAWQQRHVRMIQMRRCTVRASTYVLPWHCAATLSFVGSIPKSMAEWTWVLPGGHLSGIKKLSRT